MDHMLLQPLKFYKKVKEKWNQKAGKSGNAPSPSNCCDNWSDQKKSASIKRLGIIEL